MKLIRVKDRKEVLDALKTVYGTENAAQAEAALDAFCRKYGKRYLASGGLDIPVVRCPEVNRRA